MSAPVTVKDVLIAALALVRQGWTRGRSKKRRGDRACYCATGAVKATTSSFIAQVHAIHRLRVEIPGYDALSLTAPHVYEYNDAKGRKKTEVIALFERAIARA